MIGGGRERRNWNPSTDTAHYRLYRQWQQITGKRPVIENFCHYWRVVVFWAPLALLRQRVMHAYESKRVRVMTLVVIGVLLASGLTWLALLFTETVRAVVLGAVAAAYLGGGFFTGLHLFNELAEEKADKQPWEWLNRQEDGLKFLFGLIFSPVIIVLFALGLVLVSLVGTVLWVFEEKGFGKKLGYFLFELHPPKLWWLRPWLVFPAFAVVMAPFSRAALIAAIAMLGFVALNGLFLLVSWGVDVYRRHLAVQGDNQKQTALALQRERTEFLLRGVHARIHPKRRHNEWRFQRWLARYTRYTLREMPHLDGDEFWTLSMHWHYAQHRMWDWVDLENIRGAISQHQAPGRQSSLRVLGDFFALVWAVVVARKWKVCPIVTIEQEVIAPITTG